RDGSGRDAPGRLGVDRELRPGRLRTRTRRAMSDRIRAVGLLSGSLPISLATRILVDQGIEVVALHLESPTACRADVRAVAAELGVRLETRAKGEEYLRLLRHPRWGYGRNMNPCIDCRRFMFSLGSG